MWSLPGFHPVFQNICTRFLLCAYSKCTRVLTPVYTRYLTGLYLVHGDFSIRSLHGSYPGLCGLYQVSIRRIRIFVSGSYCVPIRNAPGFSTRFIPRYLTGFYLVQYDFCTRSLHGSYPGLCGLYQVSIRCFRIFVPGSYCPPIRNARGFSSQFILGILPDSNRCDIIFEPGSYMGIIRSYVVSTRLLCGLIQICAVFSVRSVSDGVSIILFKISQCY